MDQDETIKAFMLPDELPESYSKDRLRAEYEGFEVSESSPIKKHCYRIENLTKQKKGMEGKPYEVMIWRGSTGDDIASCDCVARTLCKHIIYAAGIHRIAREAGFIK